MNGTNYNILCVPKTCWTTSITRHDTKYLSEMPHNKKPPPQRCGLHLTLKNPTLAKPSCCQPAEPPSRLLSGAESPIPALPRRGLQRPSCVWPCLDPLRKLTAIECQVPAAGAIGSLNPEKKVIDRLNEIAALYDELAAGQDPGPTDRD